MRDLTVAELEVMEYFYMDTAMDGIKTCYKLEEILPRLESHITNARTLVDNLIADGFLEKSDGKICLSQELYDDLMDELHQAYRNGGYVPGWYVPPGK